MAPNEHEEKEITEEDLKLQLKNQIDYANSLGMRSSRFLRLTIAVVALIVAAANVFELHSEIWEQVQNIELAAIRQVFIQNTGGIFQPLMEALAAIMIISLIISLILVVGYIAVGVPWNTYIAANPSNIRTGLIRPRTLSQEELEDDLDLTPTTYRDIVEHNEKILLNSANHLGKAYKHAKHGVYSAIIASVLFIAIFYHEPVTTWSAIIISSFFLLLIVKDQLEIWTDLLMFDRNTHISIIVTTAIPLPILYFSDAGVLLYTLSISALFIWNFWDQYKRRLELPKIVSNSILPILTILTLLLISFEINADWIHGTAISFPSFYMLVGYFAIMGIRTFVETFLLTWELGVYLRDESSRKRKQLFK